MTWSRTRRVTQILILVAFGALTVSSVSVGRGVLPGTLFARLDPLIGLAAVVASRTWIAFWAAALATVVLTVVLGRTWCGWICPMGTLLDIVPARRRAKNTNSPRWWRLGKYVTLAIVVGAAVFGSLTPMMLDPVTVLTRPLQELARPFAGTDAVGQSVGASLGRGAVAGVALLSLVPLLLVLGLNAVGRRAWCRDLCPLGGLLALTSRLPGVRRVVDSELCTSCNRCTAVCPTEAIDRTANHATRIAECTDCMKCIDACPTGANSFRPTPSALRLPAYRQDRRDALIAVGATGFGLSAVMLPTRRAEDDILRPPATTEQRLSELCIRCGACYGACPTGVLRPSVSFISEAGPWTPMLDDRPAHCTLNCNRCARPCPTDAIHTPTAVEAELLGLNKAASVNRTQCRAWAHNHDCMLCQERCPISGALTGQERPFDPALPDARPVQVPVVDTSLCVACNLCLSACPMMPPAIGVDLPPFDGSKVRPRRMPRVGAPPTGAPVQPGEPPASTPGQTS